MNIILMVIILYYKFILLCKGIFGNNTDVVKVYRKVIIQSLSLLFIIFFEDMGHVVLEKLLLLPTMASVVSEWPTMPRSEVSCRI